MSPTTRTPRLRGIPFSDRLVRALLNTQPDAWPAAPINTVAPFKWQTRRIVKIKPQGPAHLNDAQGVPLDVKVWSQCEADGSFIGHCHSTLEEGAYQKECDAFTQVAYPNGGGFKPPYGIAGDYLYVREAHWRDRREPGVVVYDASPEWGKYQNTPHPIRSTTPDEKPVSREQARLAMLPKFWRKNPARYMPRWAARLFLRIERVRLERLQAIALDELIAEGIGSKEANDAAAHLGVFTVRTAYELAFIKTWDALHNRDGFGFDANPWVWVYDFARVSALPKELRA